MAEASIEIPKELHRYKKFKLVPILDEEEEPPAPASPPNNLSYEQIDALIKKSTSPKVVKKCLALWSLALKDHPPV